MHRIYITTIILSTFFLKSVSQEVNQLVKQSLTAFEQNDLQKFEEIYSHIYIAYLKENLPEYQEAVTAVREGNTKAAIQNLEELIEEDLFLDEIANDPNFTTLHNTGEWKTLIEAVNNRKSGYNNKIRLQLKEIQNRDQGIRILYLAIKDEPVKNSIHQYMKTVVDPDCAAKTAAILNTAGWLGPAEIGAEANETLFLGIQHIDDLTVQQKYLPMLQNALQTGKAEGWHVAFLTDRILMNQGRKQIYGTQKITSPDPAKSYIIPLQDPDNVDQRRAEIGLIPLAEALQDEGIQWNLEEYKKNLPAIEKMYNERNNK